MAARLLARGRKAGSRVVRAKLAPGTVADDQLVRDVEGVPATQVNIPNVSPVAHC